MGSRLSDRILTMAYLLVLGTTFLVKLKEGEFLWMAYVLLAMTCTIACYRFFSMGSLRLPSSVYAGVVLFLVMFFFLGELMMGFSKIPYWDKAIHLVSGIVLPFIGYRVYLRIREGEGSRLLAVLFTLMFGIFFATLWELHEFSTDSILGTVSQAESLRDTMLDLLAGSFGTVVTTIGLYVHLYWHPVQVYMKIEEEAKLVSVHIGMMEEKGIGKQEIGVGNRNRKYRK